MSNSYDDSEFRKRRDDYDAKWRAEQRACQAFSITCSLLVLIGMAAYFFVVQPMMEARTYTRLTGKQVSTWDALWVDLRVQDEPK